jgi:hypothetical protein
MAAELVSVLLLSGLLAALLIILTRHYGIALLQQILLT